MKHKAPVVLAAIVLAAVLFALLGSFAWEPTALPPITAPPDAGCHVLGRVLDTAGAPLRGAAVRARILSPGTAHVSPAVTTGEDGSFAIRLFPARGLWGILVSPPGRPGFTAGAPVRASPEALVRIEIREPAAPPPVPEAPNLAGEVHDSRGRLLTGIPVLVATKEGEVLLRTVSGEGGRFEANVGARPPLFVHPESLERHPFEVEILPCHDAELFVTWVPETRGEMLVDFRLEEALPNRPARIRLYNSLGQQTLLVFRSVRDGPHPLLGVFYGPYDVRVDVDGHAGAIQGFDFRPESRLAVVPLAPAASVRGTLGAKAEALLFSRSPTLVPVARSFRESDGIGRLYRGLWERAAAAERFDFGGLPAGDYRLRILAAGYETEDREFSLAADERLDLGRIELRRATGSVVLRITDSANDPEELRFGYVVRLYETGAHSFSAHVGPGPGRDARFADLPAGSYHFRVERKLEGMAHTRFVGWDRPVPVEAGETKTVEVDCTWSYE